MWRSGQLQIYGSTRPDVLQVTLTALCLDALSDLWPGIWRPAFADFVNTFCCYIGIPGQLK